MSASNPVSDDRLRNTRNWAAAQVGTLWGAEVIVAAIDEVFQLRAALELESGAHNPVDVAEIERLRAVLGSTPGGITIPHDAALNTFTSASPETSCVGCAQGWDCHPGYPNSEKRVHTPPRFIDCTAVKTSRDVPHVMPTIDKPPQ